MSRAPSRRHTPRTGTLLHNLLSVACAEPQTRAALVQRLARRGVFVDDRQANITCRSLVQRGLLRIDGIRGRASLYVLTPEGEDALDAGWENT